MLKFCANTTWLNWYGKPPCKTQCEDCKLKVKNRQYLTKEIIKDFKL